MNRPQKQSIVFKKNYFLSFTRPTFIMDVRIRIFLPVPVRRKNPNMGKDFPGKQGFYLLLTLYSYYSVTIHPLTDALNALTHNK